MQRIQVIRFQKSQQQNVMTIAATAVNEGMEFIGLTVDENANETQYQSAITRIMEESNSTNDKATYI